MGQLDRIIQKIGKLKVADPEYRLFGAYEHKYKLGEKIPELVIDKFEGIHGIKLPTGYRSFISNVGSGPCGPYYG
ncbi:MAG: SMI1/KNR4 family protein, partial [Bacteroidota bacterium]